MKIYLRNQRDVFDQHLMTLKSSPVSTFHTSTLKEVCSEIKVADHKRLTDLDLACIYEYNIFPEKILIHRTQWYSEKRKFQVGDTIVQQVFMPPLNPVSIKLIFGVRINSITEEENRIGFSYVTLDGHVETGESRFLVERRDNSVYFSIRTFSVPGNALTKMVAPIFTLPYQSYCTQLALKNVKQKLLRF